MSEIKLSFTESFLDVKNSRLAVRDRRTAISPSYHIDITGHDFVSKCEGCNLNFLCDNHKAFLTIGTAHISLSGTYLGNIASTVAKSNCVRVVTS